jgi:hypothetical protein
LGARDTMTLRPSLLVSTAALLLGCTSSGGGGGFVPDGGLGGSGAGGFGGAMGGSGGSGLGGAAGATGGAAGTTGCASGLTQCGSACVDTNGDLLHCGSCDNACPNGASCDAGACVVIDDCTQTPCTGLSYCDLGSKKCKPGCLTAAQCGANQDCNAATHECGCSAGFHDCGGACLGNDSPASCGSSCSPCPSDPHGTASCSGGQCGMNCNTGYLACSGACAACPTQGVTATECSGGQCVAKTCQSGYWKCGTSCCTFTTETVDSVDDDYDDIDIAVDAQGTPHLAYERADGAAYAKKSGSSWSKTLIDSAGYRSASITLVSGQPWVAFQTYQNTAFDVRVGRWNGSGFSVDSLTDPGCCSSWTGIAAAGTGADVAFRADYSNNGGDLRSFGWNGSSWQYRAAHGYYSSWRRGGMASDASGVAHMVYSDQYSGLEEVTWSGTQYVATNVDTAAKHVDAKIAINGSSRGILYCSSSGLQYARWSGSSWSLESVKSGSIAGCDVAIDATGRIHVSFVDGGTTITYGSWQSGSGWSFVPITTGTTSAIAVDGSGNPRIVYVNSGQIHYAH